MVGWIRRNREAEERRSHECCKASCRYCNPSLENGGLKRDLLPAAWIARVGSTLARRPRRHESYLLVFTMICIAGILLILAAGWPT